MGSANIQAKIKRGLAKAVNKTGSSSSDLVYVVKTTSTGTSSVDPGIDTEISTLLVNAIFQEYNINLIGANIQAGDRKLVSDSDVVINVGDVIRQGSTNYIVINVENKAPTSDNLAYISQVRVK